MKWIKVRKKIMRALLYVEGNGRRKDERDKIRSDNRLKY
jgi:hypothetical protein